MSTDVVRLERLKKDIGIIHEVLIKMVSGYYTFFSISSIASLIDDKHYLNDFADISVRHNYCKMVNDLQLDPKLQIKQAFNWNSLRNWGFSSDDFEKLENDLIKVPDEDGKILVLCINLGDHKKTIKEAMFVAGWKQRYCCCYGPILDLDNYHIECSNPEKKSLSWKVIHIDDFSIISSSNRPFNQRPGLEILWANAFTPSILKRYPGHRMMSPGIVYTTSDPMINDKYKRQYIHVTLNEDKDIQFDICPEGFSLNDLSNHLTKIYGSVSKRREQISIRY